MRFSEECGVKSVGSKSTGKSGFADRRIQIDTVVMNSVSPGKQAGQDRGPGRLANDARGDGIGESCALGGEQVEMGCLDPRVFYADAIAALLICRNQQEIWFAHCVSLMRIVPMTTTTASDNIINTIEIGDENRKSGSPPVAERPGERFSPGSRPG